jgi:hypothetical protein
VDDRQSTYFRKLAIKPQKFRQNKNALQINKQTREKQASSLARSRHGILSNCLPFLDELEDNAKNLSTTTKNDRGPSCSALSFVQFLGFFFG